MEGIVPDKAVICAQVVRVQDVRGSRVSLPLLWHDAMAYTTRGIIERHFNLMPDKVFRTNLAALQADETLLNDLSGDFDFGGHGHMVDATSQELRFLKLAEVVGARSSAVQLISLFMVAGVCHLQTAPAATVDALLAIACSPTPTTELTASNAREMLAAATVVIPMPAVMPEAVAACSDGAYSLALEEHQQLREQLSAFSAYAQTPLQPSRGGASLADATVSNTVQAARAILGFAYNVAHRDGTPDLRVFLDGEMNASYVAWAGTTRLKKPLTISLEVSCVVRILEYLGSGPVRLDEPNRVELDKLKTALRRLASQLSGLHRPITSVPELEAAGRWAEFSLVQERVGAEAASVLRIAEDDAARTPQLARRVHDSLLSCLVTLDCAPNRPGCLRLLKMANYAGACDCVDGTCVGNRFVGTTMVLTHTKTSRTRDAIRVDFNGTMTGQLMEHHSGWAHDMLFTGEGEADFNVWLNTRGLPFGSDESFSAYLPRVLAKLDLPHLSYTTLRHAAIVAAAEWASRDEMEGLARSIGTSTRKCAEVYDYCHAERAAGRFLHAWRGRPGGSSQQEETQPTLTPPAEFQTQTTLPRNEQPRTGMLQRIMSRFIGSNSDNLVELTRAPVAVTQPALLEDEPVYTTSAAFKPAPLLALHAHAPRTHLPITASSPPLMLTMGPSTAMVTAKAAKPRKQARVEDGIGFAEFIASRKRVNTGGPGRNAAPVLRALTSEQAEEAMTSGMSSMRTAYAYAYGFETMSGNREWLRRKIEEAASV